jgi:circadian clock protein KaiC
VRQRGITTLLTSAPPGRLTRQLTPHIAEEIASFTDVTITLRFFERAGQVNRAIVVTQTRGSAHDPGIRLATIDADGMHIGERLSAHIGILTPSEALREETTAQVETEGPQQSGE